MTTVPSVQMTETPLKLHVIKILSNQDRNDDLKSGGRFMWAFVSDIIDNSISFVDMLQSNNTVSKVTQPQRTFYAVKSTKIDKTQK